MKNTSLLFTALCVLLTPAFATDYNLGELDRARKIELFNRAHADVTAGSKDAVYLNAAERDGLAWITGGEFSQGTIELEIKGHNKQGQSFVGIAFHGQDNEAFDAVYLRPFNFQSSDPVRKSHSIQYISMPNHDWSELRKAYPGKYETILDPAPDPESWVTLKLVIAGQRLSAFVNGSVTPALTIELLNDRLQGKVALWVGDGSDGAFRNLKITRTKP